MEKKLLIKNVSRLNNNALTIYGDIGDYDNTDDDLQKLLNELDKNEPLTVYINSFGGEVSNGITMYNQLKEFTNITVIVQGFCCSIATIIAMASKKIIMKKGSLFMIHKPLCCTIGNANDLQKSIETLNKVEESILTIYQDNAKISREDLTKLMAREIFLTPEEAQEIFKNIYIEQEEEITNTAKKENEKLSLEIELM